MADDPEPTPGASARRFFAAVPLLRAVGIASSPKNLIIAAVGLLAMWAGWSALDRVFDVNGPDLARFSARSTGRVLDNLSAAGLSRAAGLMTFPARMVVEPFASVFRRQVGPEPWAWFVLRGLWALVVWALAGGAIARIAVVRAAGEPGIGLVSAVRFALRRSIALIAAPLTPLLVVAFFGVGCAAFGLLYRLPGTIGPIVATILGFLPMIAGLVMALILLGLALGWPLMIVTVAAEGEDAPDALSRSYSYVNQRLPRYLVHLAIAWAIGAVGLIVAILFSEAVLGLAGWGVGLGAPDDPNSLGRIEESRAVWIGLVDWLVHAWIYSYFWSSASILYLILRRDVDGTDWHDIYQPRHDADAFAPAPEPKAAGPEVG